MSRICYKAGRFVISKDRLIMLRAHGLTKAAVKQVMNRVWLKEIPDYMFDFVTLEQRSLFSSS